MEAKKVRITMVSYALKKIYQKKENIADTKSPRVRSWLHFTPHMIYF